MGRKKAERVIGYYGIDEIIIEEFKGNYELKKYWVILIIIE